MSLARKKEIAGKTRGEYDDLLASHEVADLLEVTLGRVHQLMTEGELKPAYESWRNGKVVVRLFKLADVERLRDLRDRFPTQGLGPRRWRPSESQAAPGGDE